MTTSSDEEEQRFNQAGTHKRSPAFLMAGAALGAAALAGIVVLAGYATGSMSRTQPHPMTVRSLLESEELADDMTLNIMAYSGDADAGIVHARVLAGLGDIRAAIQEQAPEAHDQMGSLALNPKQKEAAIRVLKAYRDGRMVGLTRKVTAAVRETALEKGDQSVLARKLAAVLTPSLSDMKQLHKEMFPGASEEFKLDLHDMPGLKSWNGEVQVDLGRRLSTDSSDVRAQAHTLFRGLERELGDAMPKAPARILQVAATSSSSTSTQNTGEASFMDCITKAVPNPAAVCSCIADNMKDVVSMVMSFLQGKS